LPTTSPGALTALAIRASSGVVTAMSFELGVRAPEDLEVRGRGLLRGAIEEALRWSELPIRRRDRCVEIGSAPGGSCAALLERGCFVTGIDAAEMDPTVLANPHFTHLRSRGAAIGFFTLCNVIGAQLVAALRNIFLLTKVANVYLNKQR